MMVEIRKMWGNFDKERRDLQPPMVAVLASLDQVIQEP
jgi:hypothetical protein